MVDQWFRRDPPVSSHRVAIQGEDPQTSVAETAVSFEWQCVKSPLRNPIVRMTFHLFDNSFVRAWFGNSDDGDVFAHSTENRFENPVLGARRYLAGELRLRWQRL